MNADRVALLAALGYAENQEASIERLKKANKDLHLQVYRLNGELRAIRRAVQPKDVPFPEHVVTGTYSQDNESPHVPRCPQCGRVSGCDCPT